MTYVAEEIIAERDLPVPEEYGVDESYMAIVDEFGQETPITELDIRRSLKQLSDAEVEAKAQAVSAEEAFDSLMHRAEAARAIV